MFSFYGQSLRIEKMNQLRHMSVFAHIVETGSITAAAESLQLSKSVVSQHLKVLEQELGITLLKRTTRRQSLTPAGDDFYQQCKKLNEIADSAWQQAQNTLQVPQGLVRITAPNALMDTLIAPAIGTLMQQYPLLVPELISNDHQLDLTANNIDLAIRVGSSKDSNLKQQRIGEFRDQLCASSALIERAETELGGIEQAPYIANTWQANQISHEFRRTETKSTAKAEDEFIRYTAQARCKADSFYTCLTLIQSGAGVGIIPDFLIDSLQPLVQPVFPDYQLPVNPVYALYPYSQNLPLSVRVCLDAIRGTLDS